MAKGTYADFTIYNSQFFAGLWYELDRFLEVFDAASANTIRMITLMSLGHYEQQSVFKHTTGMLTRRDISSTAAVTPKKLTMGELVSVKLNRKLGPLVQTGDSWRKMGKDPATVSFELGRAYANDVMADYIDSALYSVTAAIKQLGTDANYDATGLTTKTLNATNLKNGLHLYGDKESLLVALVMNSKCFNDLTINAITDKLFEEAGRVVYGAVPGTFNRPVVVTDSLALLDTVGSGVTQTYNVLALQTNAVVVKESEDKDSIYEKSGGNENLEYLFQAEHAFNVEVLNTAWDIVSGGVNPTTAALSTSGNWDLVPASFREGPGVAIKVQ